MKNIITLLAIAVGALLWAGCVGYRHTRTSEKESTALISIFKKGEASMISSDTTDGEYRRKVGLRDVKTSGDPETVKAAGEAVGNGAKSFVKP